MVDATRRHEEPLTRERLFGWHAALFPTGRSGLHPIVVGQWRDDREGPMQVVSGPVGRTHVHYEAPPAELLDAEMAAFLAWLEAGALPDPVVAAAIAHLWFVTIHPFDDGNGRIARAITELMLARAEQSGQRFYSMSAQIVAERDAYYAVLESTQKGDLDITPWLRWFLGCLDRAFDRSDETLGTVLRKARFWQVFADRPLSARQKAVLGRLLDGFEGKLTSSKYASLAKTSQDTAARDLADLVAKGLLVRNPAGGRSTSYSLAQE